LAVEAEVVAGGREQEDKDDAMSKGGRKQTLARHDGSRSLTSWRW